MSNLKVSRPASILGVIDVVVNQEIHGWMTADFKVMPLLSIDGVFQKLIEWPKLRPDVKAVLGAHESSGFRFSINVMKRGSLVELFALDQGQVIKVAQKCFFELNINDSPIACLQKAKSIAIQKNSVAITCWDGFHNPIGRAKALYDIVKFRRPAIIFAYGFSSFGTGLWRPLRDEDFDIVLIPWNDRAAYHQLIRKLEISFETIWMCKPRLPTFQLSALLSNLNTKLILDIDDNEEAFMLANPGSDKIYDGFSLGLSNYFIRSIASKTVSSISLQKKYGGTIIRHIRAARSDQVKPIQNDKKIRIGFIGTVRAHKGVLQAARAINIFQYVKGIKVEFDIYGDIPDVYIDPLKAAGANVYGSVGITELPTVLSSFDVLLGGYPDDESNNDELTRYQITAKIGDALSCQRPILIPMSESHDDLSNVYGIFQFNRSNFHDALLEALSVKFEKIVLPKTFTEKFAYKDFISLEKKASSSELLKNNLILEPDINKHEIGSSKNLLLIWKQNDAGIYGRRIDQIARSYKAKFPDRNVFVLEIMHTSRNADLKKARDNWLSDAQILLECSTLKLQSKFVDEGVLYTQLNIDSSHELNSKFLSFLANNSLIPKNTVIIVFPKINFLTEIIETIKQYPLIVDIIDNQLAWKQSDGGLELINQYATLLSIAKISIFNSENMINLFRNKFRDFFKEDSCLLIPNWYILHSSFKNTTSRLKLTSRRLIYSGNMNDRIDWDLLGKISKNLSTYEIHLIGSADRVQDKLAKLLKQSNVIYHGPLSEVRALNILNAANIAIIPHSIDAISESMNPLKISMYQALGLSVVSTNVPGLNPLPLNISICSDANQFINAIQKNILNSKKIELQSSDISNSKKYIEIIDEMLH